MKNATPTTTQRDEIEAQARADAASDRRLHVRLPRAGFHLGDLLRKEWAVERAARVAERACPWSVKPCSSCHFFARTLGQRAYHSQCAPTVDALLEVWALYRTTYEAAFAAKG